MAKIEIIVLLEYLNCTIVHGLWLTSVNCITLIIHVTTIYQVYVTTGGQNQPHSHTIIHNTFFP